jgi:predicted nucleic acid-binding protein
MHELERAVWYPRIRRRIASSDDADHRLLEAAVAGGADYIFTGDNDLLAIREHEGIPIVTVRQFLELIETTT